MTYLQVAELIGCSIATYCALVFMHMVISGFYWTDEQKLQEWLCYGSATVAMQFLAMSYLTWF